MRVRYYFHIVYNNLIRRKRQVISHSIIIVLALITLMSTISMASALDDMVNNYIFQSPKYRTYNIVYYRNDKLLENKLFDILSEEEHVLEYYIRTWEQGGFILNDDELFEASDRDHWLFFYAADSSVSVITGEAINKNSKNVGIIPKQFYTDNNYEIGFEKEPDDFLDGEDFIGKEITMRFYAVDFSEYPFKKINPMDYTFKVIGVYDIGREMRQPYEVYIPYDDLRNIDEELKNRTIGGSEDLGSTISFIVDDVNNAQGVFDRILSELMVPISPMATLGIIQDLGGYILIVGSIISIIVILIALINISLSTLKMVKKRTAEIGLLKAMGYKNNQIATMLSLESTAIGCISLAGSVSFVLLLIKVLNWLIQSRLSIQLRYLNLSLKLDSLVIAAAISLLIPLVTGILGMRYALKISPTEAIKAE